VKNANIKGADPYIFTYDNLLLYRGYQVNTPANGGENKKVKKGYW
jgi:hypothetical protein